MNRLNSINKNMKKISSIVKIELWILLHLSVTKSISISVKFPEIKYDLNQYEMWSCPSKCARQIKELEINNSVAVLCSNGTSIIFIKSATSSNEVQLNDEEFCSDCKSLERGNLTEHDLLPNDLLNRSKRSTNNEEHWFKSYHNLSSIYDWFENLSLEHPNLITLLTIGKTHYGNDILAVRLTNNVQLTTKQKPIVYIQCLLHAREWITGPTCAYIAYELATINNNDQRINILDEIEVIIVPVANPDGYKLTWIDYPKYRMWRKNAIPNPDNDKCIGVDLNRNFDVQWGIHGSSQDHCSDIYSGSAPTSELETKAITNLITKHKPLLGALDFHSYSQAILYPSGWSTDPIKNVDKVQSIAKVMAKAASQYSGTDYSTQQMGAIYLASGTFTDWINSKQVVDDNKDEYGVRYQPIPLTVELRPKDINGFLNFMVQPNQILPNCKEIFNAVYKLLTSLIDNKEELIIE